MKHILITAFFAVASLSFSFASPSDDSKVSYKVLNEFSTNFSSAENVTWKVTDEFYKASFVIEEENMEAFFNTNGELVATSQKMDFNKLPKKAKDYIKVNYKNSSFVQKECIKITNAEGVIKYYISLKNNNKSIALEVDYLGNVSLFK